MSTDVSIVLSVARWSRDREMLIYAALVLQKKVIACNAKVLAVLTRTFSMQRKSDI